MIRKLLHKLFKKKSEEPKMEQIEVPQDMECAKEVAAFLRRLDIAYELSKQSQMFFGPVPCAESGNNNEALKKVEDEREDEVEDRFEKWQESAQKGREDWDEFCDQCQDPGLSLIHQRRIQAAR